MRSPGVVLALVASLAHGYTSWRLPGLQKAIRAGRVPSFRAVTRTTTEEFYGADPGSNQGEARYYYCRT